VATSSQGGVHIQDSTIFQTKMAKVIEFRVIFLGSKTNGNVFFTKNSKIKPISTRIIFGWVTLLDV
jgi:hypothetical protein